MKPPPKKHISLLQMCLFSLNFFNLPTNQDSEGQLYT